MAYKEGRSPTEDGYKENHVQKLSTLWLKNPKLPEAVPSSIGSADGRGSVNKIRIVLERFAQNRIIAAFP